MMVGNLRLVAMVAMVPTFSQNQEHDARNSSNHRFKSCCEENLENLPSPSISCNPLKFALGYSTRWMLVALHPAIVLAPSRSSCKQSGILITVTVFPADIANPTIEAERKQNLTLK
jgi:hypothetical protein